MRINNEEFLPFPRFIFCRSYKLNVLCWPFFGAFLSLRRVFSTGLRGLRPGCGPDGGSVPRTAAASLAPPSSPEHLRTIHLQTHPSSVLDPKPNLIHICIQVKTVVISTIHSTERRHGEPQVPQCTVQQTRDIVQETKLYK